MSKCFRLALLVGLCCTSCGCASLQASATTVRLSVLPPSAPIGEPLRIVVTGLSPHTLITVRATTTDYQNRGWSSVATYRSNKSGQVDLSTTAPLSGSYHVPDSGGLLWSLTAVNPSDTASQFLIGKGGFRVRLSVSVEGSVVATSSLIRRTVVPGESLRLVTMASAGLVGTLYLPHNAAPKLPAVVVLGGSGGGEDLLVASALAGQGFPTLALAYFGEPGLPSCLCAIPLEYFAHALTWVKRQPKLAGRPVVLLGSSRGAEAALLVADSYPTDLSAVVLGSPTDEVNHPVGGYYNGSAWTLPGQGIPVGEKIPLSRVTMPVLIGAGGADEIWDSSDSASYIMSNLPKTSPGSSASVHVNLTYANAGHEFVAPPYVPYDVKGRGGTEEGNQLALEAFWPRLIAFLASY